MPLLPPFSAVPTLTVPSPPLLLLSPPQADSVFVDDYVLPSERVMDYLTRFSGLTALDLDPSSSRHHLVTPRTAYLKLRCVRLPRHTMQYSQWGGCFSTRESPPDRRLLSWLGCACGGCVQVSGGPWVCAGGARAQEGLPHHERLRRPLTGDQTVGFDSSD